MDEETIVNLNQILNTINTFDEQKIVVNVINDNPSPKSILKSNTIIGSKTMEDLFQVVNNQRSTSMIERVIISDRPALDPPEKSLNNRKCIR